MTTTVVYAGTADGWVNSTSGFDDEFDGYAGTYAAARAGTGTPGLTASTAATTLSVGQLYFASFFDQYGVQEGFLGFDTSAIADTDTVSAAVLNVTSYGDFSTTDFTIEARLRDWGGTLETTDFVAGASLSALTLLASKTTASGFTADTAYDFTDVAMPANVNKTGSTYLLLCSSRTTGNNAPTGYEYVNVKSADTTGTTSDPKLTVTHAAGGGTTVTPTTLALTTAAFAPTVTASANVTATPTVAALTLTTFAPVVSAADPQLVTPSTASLSLTAFAPTVTASDHQTVTPTTLGLTLTAFAPTTVISDHQLVTPTTLALALTAYAPTVTASGSEVLDAIGAALRRPRPVPVQPVPVPPVHQIVTPHPAALLLTTFAPTIDINDDDQVLALLFAL